MQINFGLYRGKYLNEIPFDYLLWLYECDTSILPLQRKNKNNEIVEEVKKLFNYNRGIVTNYVIPFGKWHGKCMNDVDIKHIIYIYNLKNINEDDPLNIRNFYPEAIIMAEKFLINKLKPDFPVNST